MTEGNKVGWDSFGVPNENFGVDRVDLAASWSSDPVRSTRMADVIRDDAGLVGRDDELARLAAFTVEATTTGAALVLTGEAGVGKTSLLDATVARAAGTVRVISASGSEYETDIGFATLHQLVVPLVDDLALLPRAMAEALEVALGLGVGPAPSRIAVFNAALALFSAAAERQPLLLVVDDLQFVDEASRAAAGFVGRRLRGRRIGLLGARRSESSPTVQSIGVPEEHIQPLDDRGAARLLSHRFAHLPSRVRLELTREAQGNPLALVEFAGSTDLSVPWTGADNPQTDSQSKDVRTLFAARIHALPARARDLLLVAALEGRGDLRTVEAASGPGTLLALAPAERDDLVSLTADGRTIRFRHPLVRTAVVETSTGLERCNAHQRLAGALTDDIERHADHLARATTRPDEAVAALLQKAAQRSLRRGDAAGAVTRLRRSADLSPDRTALRRRLSLAAYLAAWVEGQLQTSEEILRELRLTEESTTPGGAVAKGFVALITDGDADASHALAANAVRSLPATGASADEHDRALLTLTLASQYSGRPEHWRPLMEYVDSLPEAAPHEAASLARIHFAPGSVTEGILGALEDALGRLEDETDADVVVRTALAASYLDRLSACRRPVARVIQDGRDGGAVGSSMPALMFVALDELHSARWSESAAAAAELITLSERTGYHVFRQVGHYISAMAAAHLGDLDACAEHSDLIRRWSAPRGLRRLEYCAHQASGRALVGAGEFEDAYAHLSAICTPGELPPFNPEAVWSAPDLVEAAIRTGRADEARSHAGALHESGIHRISPRFAIMTATATAMTSPEQTAAARFEDALAVPGADDHPFESGRARLAYGEHLRRLGRIREARAQLAAARDTFHELGAATWALRATAELRATGMTRTARGAVGTALTPQELEIARMAASGLSNPQIAARLVLSPRTVSTHLYRVFPKLGITSRAALRDALESAPGQ